MEFSKFDKRSAADAGYRKVLLDPDTQQPLGDGDDAPVAIVRGYASRTAQQRLKDITKKKPKGDDAASMEDFHRSMIDTALVYLIGFENVEIDGKPVADEAGYRKVLDMTFPEMRVKADAYGEPVMREGKDGAMVPEFEPVNKPFATQIIEAASEMGNSSGSASKT